MRPEAGLATVGGVRATEEGAGRDVESEGSGVAFLLRFALFTVASFTMLSVVSDDALEPYLLVLAALCAGALDLLGFSIVRHGTVIAAQGFSVDVTGQCSALYETALLGSAILASTGSLVRRMIGVLAGTTALFVLNLIRIATLVIIGVFAPQWFDHAHLFVWQALLVAAVAACWLAWLGQARPAAAS